MKRFQGSILKLMTFVAGVAMFFQAARTLTQTWEIIIVNLTMVVLIVAAIRARYATDSKASAWWFGFALFGWGYAVFGSTVFRFESFVYTGMESLHSAFYSVLLSGPNPPFTNLDNEQFSRSFRLFHLFGCLLTGSVGALIGSFFHRWIRRKPELDPSRTPSRSSKSTP